MATQQQPTRIEYVVSNIVNPWVATYGDEWDTEDFATLAEAQAAYPDATLAQSALDAVAIGIE